MTAQNYLKHGSNATIVRITPGTYSPAVGYAITGSHPGMSGSDVYNSNDASISPMTRAYTGGGAGYASIKITTLGDGDILI